MSIDSQQAALVGALIMLNVFMVVKLVKTMWDKFKMELEYANHPHIVEHNPLRACEGPHTWRVTTLALRGLPPGDYKVCHDCGSIFGFDEMMLSEEAIAQLKESIALIEQQNQVAEELNSRVSDLADAYIDRFISSKFADALNDVEFTDKLKELTDYVLVAHLQAREKVIAEIDVQKDLDDKYSGWPSKVKGNA